MAHYARHKMAKNMAKDCRVGAMSPRRRDYRTGSIYQRASDGRWMGTIEAGFTASGARRRVTVSGKTRSQVVRKLRDKRLDLDKSGNRNVKRTTTVAKWSARWLDSIQPHIRPSAYETDKAAMRYVVQAIGSVNLADLTPADVRAVAAAVRKARTKAGKPLSSSTALRYHGSLMRMLKAASLDGYNIAPNVLLTEKPKAATSDREAVTEADAAKVIPYLATLPDGSRWVLAFLQGLRQAEALGLTWDQVDLDAGTLTVSWQAKSLRYAEKGNPSAGFQVPDGYEVRHLVGSTHLVRPKSKAGWRVIPLVPWAVNSLTTWRDIAPPNPHRLVWPGRINRGGAWPRNPASDREQWEAIQTAVGVSHPTGRPYHVHEIRHGTATLLMRLGVPESVRIAIMGHSSIAVTQGYEHVDLTLARQAMEQAAARLELQ